MLLLCAGAAASLAGVWTLAGLSESSALRVTPRVIGAAAVGLLGEALLYGRSPAELRGELALPLLFGTASVLALAVGAAKIEAALAEKNGARVVRRASGILVGSFLGMAAVGAASLDLRGTSLSHAQLGWALMFGLTASSLIVFSQRARYAGVALLALGQRAWLLAVAAVALLAGARLTVAAPASDKPQLAPAVSAPVVSAPVVSAPVVSAPVVSAPVVSGSAAEPSPSPAAAPSVVPAPSTEATAAPSAAAPSIAASAPAPTGKLELSIEAIKVRGMLEADARGGVSRRIDRLQACLAEPQNQAAGSVTIKVGLDAAGSVAFSRASAGELKDSPLAACLVPVFYKMGFAAPASGNSGFEITLRTTSP